MKLWYYHAPGGNFGDDLNTRLWPSLLPLPIENCFGSDTLFVGTGTVLNEKIPAFPMRKLVFGSGYGTPPLVTDQWKFYCVRGPLTAQALGLAPKLAITDSAALIRELLYPSYKTEFQAVYIPHHWNAFNDDWSRVCESVSIRYIDPRRPVEDVLSEICHSSLVITEALHGAILADTYRIPWIPVRTRRYINGFKWQDWSASLGLEHRFEWLPPVWSSAASNPLKRGLHTLLWPAAKLRLQWLLEHGERRLSDNRRFSQVYGRLIEKVDELINDLAQVQKDYGAT